MLRGERGFLHHHRNVPLCIITTCSGSALATHFLTLFLDPTQIFSPSPSARLGGQVGTAQARWRHSASSIRIRNTAPNRLPGATNRRPRPLVRALVGAVIGSSAI